MYLFGCLPAEQSCCIFDKGYFANDFGIYRVCQSSLISLSLERAGKEGLFATTPEFLLHI